jgi:DNA-directed RNA polymerase subunit M/transcription elongation factor TFIIS
MVRQSKGNQYNPYTVCPKCSELSVFIIDSRKTKDGIRRRKKCESCGYRYTTREILDKTYQQLVESQRIVTKVQNLFGGKQVMKNSHTCEQCSHWSSFGCGMGFPEAGGTFAEECSVFVLQ